MRIALSLLIAFCVGFATPCHSLASITSPQNSPPSTLSSFQTTTLALPIVVAMPIHRILYAEDDDDLRSMLKGALETNGYHVTAVSNQMQALQKFQLGYFSLVLTDGRMPRPGDGDGLIKEIRIQDPSQKVLLLSGDDDSMGRAKKGGYPSLDKLETVQCVIDTVRNLLADAPALPFSGWKFDDAHRSDHILSLWVMLELISRVPMLEQKGLHMPANLFKGRWLNPGIQSENTGPQFSSELTLEHNATTFLRAHGVDAFGLSPDVISDPEQRFVQGVVQSMPMFPDDYFSGILSIALFEHYYALIIARRANDPNFFSHAVAEMRRVLKDNGYLLVDLVGPEQDFVEILRKYGFDVIALGQNKYFAINHKVCSSA